MSTSIPCFVQVIAPLRELLEQCFAITGGKRTKKSIARVRLKDLGWDQRHDDAFHALQAQFQECVKLAHRNPAWTLCVHTDASEFFWAVAVTQCDPLELDKPHLDQLHEPLAFLSGKFTARETHWTNYEREDYAMVQAFKRLEYLLTCDTTTTIFTDHRNLLFVFNPLAMVPSLGRHTVLKVIRWALYLSSFQYRIEHVDGDKNLWPDIMTRWMRGYRKVTKQARINRVSAKLGLDGISNSPLTDESTWQTKAKIQIAQSLKKQSLPKKHTVTDNLIHVNGAVRIPNDDINLKLRIITIAEAGTSGHRGIQPTYQTLKPHFYWNNQFNDVKEFVNACLLCTLAKGPDRVPRPLAITIHASRPNQIIHFDYLYLGFSQAKSKYAFVVKDDLSGYCWLESIPSADAENDARILSKWIRIFTVPELWISDQGRHFKNETMELLARNHNIKHNFSVAYSPWINGTVESMMRSVPAATKALLAELKLAPNDWELVLPLVNYALNESPTDRLGKRTNNADRTPLEVMTCIRPNKAIMQINPLLADSTSIHIKRAKSLINISQLQHDLFDMHKEVAHTVTKRLWKEIDAHNQLTNIVTPSFAVGDFVLLRRATNQGHTLLFKWIGPARVTSVFSKLVYGVTALTSDKEEKVHCTRLLPYKDQLVNTEATSNMLEFVNRINADYEVVKQIMDIDQFDGKPYFHVQWEGLPDPRDRAMQDAHILHTDIPEISENYLSTATAKPKLRRRVRDLLNLSS